MPWADTGAVTTYYESQGRGEPVLLLHNYFATLADWQSQRDALSRYYRVVACDLRGHGRTRFSGRIRLTDVADDVAALIRRLDLGPVHLVGSSLGALAALTVARVHPDLVRTLVADGPPHLDEPTTWGYMERFVREGYGADPERWERAHPEQGPHHVRDVLVPNFLADREERPDDQLAAISLAGAIGAPTLVVGGDNDEVFPVRRAVALHERIPGSELCILPRAGHLPQRALPGVFNDLLLDFLRRAG